MPHTTLTGTRATSRGTNRMAFLFVVEPIDNGDNEV
jgi:hypothetical protein